MNVRHASLLVCVLTLVGCFTPATIQRTPPPASEPVARLTVFRQSAFNAYAVTAIIGIDGHDVAEIPRNSFVTLELVAGEHEIYVRELSDRPSRIVRTLRADEELVLEAVPNGANFLKAAFSQLFYLLSSTFSLQPGDRAALEAETLRNVDG
jgi:hypothetical protein